MIPALQVGLPIRLVTYRDAKGVTAVTVKIPDLNHDVEFLLQVGLLCAKHKSRGPDLDSELGVQAAHSISLG